MKKAERRQPVPPCIFFLMLTMLLSGGAVFHIVGVRASREELDETDIIFVVPVALTVCGSIIRPCAAGGR